jgi:hypothetical protein
MSSSTARCDHAFACHQDAKSVLFMCVFCFSLHRRCAVPLHLPPSILSAAVAQRRDNVANDEDWGMRLLRSSACMCDGLFCNLEGILVHLMLYALFGIYVRRARAPPATTGGGGEGKDARVWVWEWVR